MENPGICLHSGSVRTDTQNSVLGESLYLFTLSSASFCVNGSLFRKCFPSTPDLRKIGPLLSSQPSHETQWQLSLTPLLFFLFLFLLYFALQYCIGFAILWHESQFFTHNFQWREEDARNRSQMGNQMAPLPTINQDTTLCWHVTAVGYSLVLETLLRFPAFSSSNWRWWILKS